jgi:WD40 repeat protein/serine/threonine protein kinase
MPPAPSDLNMLFGMLALQLDFITKDHLLAAMQVWMHDKTKSLSQIFADQKVLADDRRQLLDALVLKHLEQHNNDLHQSLAALSSRSSAREIFEGLGDPDVDQSIQRVRELRDEAPDPDETPSWSESGPTRFRILRPHAQGGLGIVYVAWDQEVGREVALKEIQERHGKNADTRARFVQEAEITGALEHPGIVPVYGLGQYADGRPYYAMRFIKGNSLKEAVNAFHQADVEGRDPTERNLALRQLLRRFIDVCNAIEYAHSKGILHRDLKPGNIMLGKYGETLVVDWGLAKSVGRAEIAASDESVEIPVKRTTGGDSSPTQMGSALGTPAFMSPEQAAGRLDLLGPASDVYGLGATLYYVLTGQPPVVTDDVADVLRRVQAGDFPRPRHLKPTIDPPLEAVCMKAMSKEPKDRYEGAAALRKDLENWIADAPVSAWPEPITVRARRVLGRHKVLAATTVAALVVAVGFLGVLARVTSTANDQLSKLADDEKTAKLTAEAARTDADSQRKRAEKALLDSEWQLYARNLALAQSAWNDHDVGLMHQYLDACRWDFRGWEHDYLYTLATKNQTTMRGHPSMLSAVTFSADGKQALTADAGGWIKVSDVATGKEVRAFGLERNFDPMSFSDDGNWILGVRRSGTQPSPAAKSLPAEAKLWRVATGKESTILAGFDDSFGQLTFSPDAKRIAGSRIASAGKRFLCVIRFWDANSGKMLFDIKGRSIAEPNDFEWRFLNADGSQIIGLYDGTVTTWDVSTGKEMSAIALERIESILSDRGTGHYPRTLPGVVYAGDLFHSKFNPDRSRLIGFSRTQGHIWDTKTGRKTLTLKGDMNEVFCVAFSGDGKRIAAGDRQGYIKLWNADTGDELRVFKGHIAPVMSLSFDPKANTIVSGSEDRTVKLWDTNASAGPTRLEWNELRNTDLLSISFDAMCVATASFDNAIHVWSATTGKELFALKGHGGRIRCFSFGRGGSRIVSGGDDKTVKIWDLASGHELASFEGHAGPVVAAALSPDGKYVISATDNTTDSKGKASARAELKVWDAETRKLTLDLSDRLERNTQGAWPVRTILFSDDSRLVLIRDALHRVNVLDTSTGLQNVTLASRYLSEANSTIVSFRAENKRIATFSFVGLTAGGGDLGFGGALGGPPLRFGGAAGALAQWDATTGARTQEVLVKGHTQDLNSAALSPDGKRAVTAGSDKTLRVWNAATGQELLTMKGSEVVDVAFSPDGKTLMICDSDGLVTFLDARTKQPVQALLAEDYDAIRFSGNGERILGESGYSAKTWDIRTGKESFVLHLSSAVGAEQEADEPYPSFAFDRSSTRVVCCGGRLRGAAAEIWNMAKGTKLATLNAKSEQITRVCMSADGTRVVTIGMDGDLRIWDAKAGVETFALKGASDKESFLLLSADGRLMLSRKRDGKSWKHRLWDLTMRKEVTAFDADQANGYYDFTPDGKRIFLAEDKVVRVWNAVTFKESFHFERSSESASFSFSPDGRRIAIGEGDLGEPGEIKILDGEDGHVLYRFKAHLSSIARLQFSEDGKMIASTGYDNSIKVWDARTGREITTIYGANLAQSAAFNPDGSRIVVCYEDGVIRIWKVPTSE